MFEEVFAQHHFIGVNCVSLGPTGFEGSDPAILSACVGLIAATGFAGGAAAVEALPAESTGDMPLFDLLSSDVKALVPSFGAADQEEAALKSSLVREGHRYASTTVWPTLRPYNSCALTGERGLVLPVISAGGHLGRPLLHDIPGVSHRAL